MCNCYEFTSDHHSLWDGSCMIEGNEDVALFLGLNTGYKVFSINSSYINNYLIRTVIIPVTNTIKRF